jgi:glucosamine--fructose-6-phosphate aminotransferase (isomerizing)
MAADIRRQLDDLPTMPLPAPVQGDIAFVGSGDSHAAALAAYYFSAGRASCHHPDDVIADPSLVHGRKVYFVSISGRTQANIRAARTAKSASAHTTAITANPNSPLAKSCESVFELRYKSAGRTAGTIGFAASALTCTHLATQGRTGYPADLARLHDRALRAAARLAGRIKPGTAIILADSYLFPAAMYGALKFNEVLGSRTYAYPSEEFFHAPLFGLQRGDRVLILGRNPKNVGINIDCEMPSKIDSFFYAMFFFQHLVLAIARKRRMKECYFLANKRLLKKSSDFIY